MITCIKIQQEMNCEYICGQIQKAILAYQKHSPDLTGALLIIDIKQIIDYIVPTNGHALSRYMFDHRTAENNNACITLHNY